MAVTFDKFWFTGSVGLKREPSEPKDQPKRLNRCNRYIETVLGSYRVCWVRLGWIANPINRRTG
ncbi:MAG: hypothetical protein RMY31_026270 [Dendronalium sp. ChiSLP03b]